MHAKPEQADRVKERLTRLPGVEVHAASDSGKLVVTIESERDRDTADTFERISRTKDVLSAALVYHQIETDPDMEA